ncbi:MAG TPA: phosphopantetheine-binding protein [Gammaproteobacteria bacterium]|nr:phosphopantetheine-binding protein [Gammaproteobacteria bacterium]
MGSRMQADTIKGEVAAMLVEAVNLDIAPADIDPQQPLFGSDGIGLDSIDALELSLAISVRYGFQMRAADAQRHQAFANLRSLSRYIQIHRQK